MPWLQRSCNRNSAAQAQLHCINARQLDIAADLYKNKKKTSSIAEVYTVVEDCSHFETFQLEFCPLLRAVVCLGSLRVEELVLFLVKIHCHNHLSGIIAVVLNVFEVYNGFSTVFVPWGPSGGSSKEGFLRGNSFWNIRGNFSLNRPKEGKNWDLDSLSSNRGF